METTSFTALVRAMRHAQQTYFKDRNRASLIAAKEAERAVDTALVVLPDNRPGILSAAGTETRATKRRDLLPSLVCRPPRTASL